MEYLHWALILLGAVAAATGAKIIMSSPQFGSHILEQVTLGEELVSRGHQVYIAIASRYPQIGNIEKKGIKAIQFRIPDDVLFGVSSDYDKAMIALTFSEESDKLKISGNFAATTCYRDCAYMMNDDQFLDEVRRLSFYLAIIEPFVAAPCNVILSRYLGIPFVSMSALYFPWKHGIPALPSFSPLLQAWTSLSDITLASRFQNLFMYAFSDAFMDSIVPRNISLLEKFAPEFSNWNDLINLSELFLASNDHHLSAVVPLMPNYISMAGLSTSKAKKLPEDLEKIAESSKDGIILLSFGSSAHYFPGEVIAKFLDAFAKLKETVLVKFHIPKNISAPENVKALSWLPQNDILGHPKTRLFITHCGNNGQHEALYHGVPMLGFPLFAEQHINCERSYKKGFGLKMTIQDFTSEELLKNIREILDNPKYKTAIQKASDTFRDQPMHPKERAVFWIEHVIRNGGGHLRSFSMDMPLYQFLMLDILGLILVSAFLFLICVRMLLTFIYRKCNSAAKSKGPKFKSS